jgi:hypothetical protein
MPQLDYSRIFSEVLGDPPWDPRIAKAGYRGLDTRVRELLVEAGKTGAIDERTYRQALKQVVAELTSSVTTDPLTSGAYRDLREAQRRVPGARSGHIDTNTVPGRNTYVLRGLADDGLPLTGVELHAKAETLLALRGKTVEAASSDEYSAAISEAARVLYSPNGDGSPEPGAKLSPWARARVLENCAGTIAQKMCDDVGDQSPAAFKAYYEVALRDLEEGQSK